jgi:hypothetical protein
MSSILPQASFAQLQACTQLRIRQFAESWQVGPYLANGRLVRVPLPIGVKRSLARLRSGCRIDRKILASAQQASMVEIEMRARGRSAGRPASKFVVPASYRHGQPPWRMMLPEPLLAFPATLFLIRQAECVFIRDPFAASGSPANQRGILIAGCPDMQGRLKEIEYPPRPTHRLMFPGVARLANIQPKLT